MDWLFKFVPFFIIFVFVLIIGYWCLVGFLAYKAVGSIDKCGGLAVCAGKVVSDFKKGMNEGSHQ